MKMSEILRKLDEKREVGCLKSYPHVASFESSNSGHQPLQYSQGGDIKNSIEDNQLLLLCVLLIVSYVDYISICRSLCFVFVLLPYLFERVRIGHWMQMSSL